MACYDISAEICVSVVVDIQVDACNPELAEQEARRELERYAPTLPGGHIYDLDVQNVTVKRRA